MAINVKTILEELTSGCSDRDKPKIVESRGNHIITSAINLLENIKNMYGEEIASELEKRLLNSIKAKDAAKFSRAVRRLK